MIYFFVCTNLVQLNYYLIVVYTYDHIYNINVIDKNLKLSINSNLGAPDDLIDKLIQKLDIIINEQRVKEVIIFTSCDAYGKQAEYVRYGLDFEKLMSNIDKILLLLPKVTIVVMSTFNIFSIFSYERLISKIYDLKLKHFNTERFWNSAIILDTSYLRFPTWHYCHVCGNMKKLSPFSNSQKCEPLIDSNGDYMHKDKFKNQPYLTR